MKTIAQHVQDGISTLLDLQDALQTAMQLEFATIPPYLCAQWSINSDPSGVGNMIRNVRTNDDGLEQGTTVERQNRKQGILPILPFPQSRL
jgi:hypothetical protein